MRVRVKRGKSCTYMYKDKGGKAVNKKPVSLTCNLCHIDWLKRDNPGVSTAHIVR